MTLTLCFVALIAGVIVFEFRGMPITAARALANADTYELLSLDPKLSISDFHNHKIIGRLTISDPATQQRLSAALHRGARESSGSVSTCFNPRHAIRVTHAGQTTDFVICFECKQLQVWRDEKEIAFIPITRSPESVFDEVLQSADVPLAPKSP